MAVRANGVIHTVVQKYGGTSVGSAERFQAVAGRVKKQFLNSPRIAVVVSAMAGETNRFVELVHEVNPSASAKSYDMAVSAGEQVSVALLSAALEKIGVRAEPFLAYQLGIYTDPSHAKARIQSIDIGKIEACWRQAKIPVVAGFQGVTSDLALTTLGRGGSDTSAVALAVALKADLCEINTDVDGVYTADPRVVPEAELIREMDYETALELSALGGKVLHSRCVEVAAKYGLTLQVRNSFDGVERAQRSTVIMEYDHSKAIEAPVVSGVMLDSGVAKVSVEGLPNEPSSISRVLQAVSLEKINVDVIVHNSFGNVEETRVGFTVAEGDLDKTIGALRKFIEESKSPTMRFSHRNGLAKVSAVGLGMKSYSGVASDFFSVLANANIEIVMISTSEIKISAVVKQEQARQAVNILHDHFFKS